MNTFSSLLSVWLIPQGLHRLQRVIFKFLQSSQSLSFKLTRKDRFELPTLQDTAVIWHQQSCHFNQQCSYSVKHISDLQPNHARENCIHTPWYCCFSVIHYCIEAGQKTCLKDTSAIRSSEEGQKGQKAAHLQPTVPPGLLYSQLGTLMDLSKNGTVVKHTPRRQAFLPPPKNEARPA